MQKKKLLPRPRWTHEWLVGQGEMPKELWNRDSPVWTRFYSSPGGVELGEEAEADLQKVRCAVCVCCYFASTALPG